MKVILICFSVTLMCQALHVKRKFFGQRFLENGYYVFEDMDRDFVGALRELRKQALTCNEDRFVIDLEDGSKRLTLARDEYDDFPDCVRKNVLKISQQFNKIDKFIVDSLIKSFPKDINITKNDEVVNFDELPARTHLHSYLSHPGEKNNLFIEEKPLSVPFHTDRGLFLLITPSQQYPLKIVSREGDVIDLQVSDKSVLCLMGTGLTEWLLPAKGLYAPPHAVPALKHASSRTVLARMKMVPLQARNTNSDVSFGEHFYSVLHQSAKTTLEERHLTRMRRQVESHDISQHWPGQVTQQNTTSDD